MSKMVNWNDKAVLREMQGKQKIALNKCGVTLERDIKMSMKKGIHKPYIRQKATGGKGAKYHWSSAPGQPPAVDTGRLRASITFQTDFGPGTKPEPNPEGKSSDGIRKPPKKTNELICVVGTNVKYGKYLELGTRRMSPRPFLRTSLERNRRKILSFFNFMR